LIGLIDSHIHLDDSRLVEDRYDLIDDAENKGVEAFIVPAVTADKFSQVMELSSNYASVYGALGLHPYYINQHTAEDLEKLSVALSHKNVIGVGECGLDFYLKELDQNKQKLVYEAQVVLAKHYNLPLILHVRGAVDAVFQVLKKHDYFNAVMHSFNGSIEQAKQIIEKGVFLGFGPAACNPKATKLKSLLEFVPAESMLLETDAPDQPFYDKQGERNLPVDLLRVNQEIAKIKQMDSIELAQQTTSNATRLFNL